MLIEVTIESAMQCFNDANQTNRIESNQDVFESTIECRLPVNAKATNAVAAL
jgi:hypothetical protein